MHSNNRITLSEAADRLDVTADTLRQQANRGVLRAERIDTPRGAVWMVSVEEVERYRREHLRTNYGR